MSNHSDSQQRAQRTPRRAAHVINTHEEIKHKCISLNTVTFNTMLDACSKSHAKPRATSSVEELRPSAVEMDVIIHSILVKGYYCEGVVVLALRVKEAMKSLGGLDCCSKILLVDDGWSPALGRDATRALLLALHPTLFG